MRSERMGMFPNNVIGSSSESNATITFVDTDARAGVSAIGARSLAGDCRSDIRVIYIFSPAYRCSRRGISYRRMISSRRRISYRRSITRR